MKKFTFLFFNFWKKRRVKKMLLQSIKYILNKYNIIQDISQPTLLFINILIWLLRFIYYSKLYFTVFVNDVYLTTMIQSIIRL